MSESEEKKKSLVNEVIALLRNEIVQKLEAGEEMMEPERVLAEKFGVSRPVIRESVIRLSMLGLLEVEHGRGTRIVQNYHKAIQEAVSIYVPNEARRLRELMEVRLVIEPEVAALAAEKVKKEHLFDLMLQQEVFIKASGSKDEEIIQKALEADIRFHEILSEITGNKILSILLKSLRPLEKTFKWKSLYHGGVDLAYHEHETIFKALSKGDSAFAHMAMKDHLASTLRNLMTNEGLSH